jgi:peptidoglycan/xylan/chitin deacetylase (PgdA/CDA1 family)
MNQRRSCILTYHSLDRTGSVISISPDLFRAQMAWLAGSGIRVAPLQEIRGNPGAAAITFDDGFRNFYECAFPVLRQYNFPATVFVVSGYCGRSNDWPSQPQGGIPSLEMMSWSEVEEVSRAGISIGAHTVTHPRMDFAPEAEIERELRVSRATIEDHIGKAVETFAYPYGRFTPTIRTAVERHFRLACGTNPAFVDSDADPVALPRIDVYYLRNQMWFRSLGARHGRVYVAARRWAAALRHRLMDEHSPQSGDQVADQA